MLEALGLIEVVGLVGAIEAADTASKAADVKVIGYELTKGSGMASSTRMCATRAGTLLDTRYSVTSA